MTAVPAPRLVDPLVPSRVGPHPVTAPRGAQTWCQANATLYETVLAERPPASDREGRAVYREGVDVARDLCSRLCPRFEECLRSAIEGPPIEGFVAGTTPAERARHRAHLRVEERPEPVNDYVVGISTQERRRRPTDHDVVDAAIRRMPGASIETIARAVDVSQSTVKRRRQALRENVTGPGNGAAGRSVEEHVDTYYALRETS